MPSTPQDYDLFFIFVAVADELSFSKAAQKLKVTKGTVSRAIARLEERLGASLFYRTTHHVTLSAAGRGLYEEAAPSVYTLRGVGEALSEHGKELSGDLRVAAPHDVGVVVLPGLLQRFSELHPNVALDVRIGNAQVDLVREGIDLALRVSRGMLEDSTLSVRRIGFGTMKVYASPAYLARAGRPKRIDDKSHVWAVFRDAMPDGSSPRYRVDDFLLLREIVRSGLAVGVLPTFLAEPLEQAGELASVLPRFSTRTAGGFFLVYPARRRPSPKVIAFRDVLLERFESLSPRR